MAPVIDAFTVDRLAHLLRARRADRALRLVELETGGIERHADEIEHAAHLAFGVVDDAFVEHAVHGTGLHLIEAAHEAPIIAVESADRLETVGKAEADSVILFEVG